MSSAMDYGFTLSYDEMRRISEAQIRDPNSQIYMRILNEIAKKYTVHYKLRDDARKKEGKKRTRIYVPYMLDSEHKYELQRQYREFEIVMATAERSSSSLARAASICVGEAMLSYVPSGERDLISYGTSLRTLVMRNREWIHLCQSANDPQGYLRYQHEDQALFSIYQSLQSKKKNMPIMLKRYITAEVVPTCSVAHRCTKQANVATAVLDGIDTNYRQLVKFMRQHGVRLLFFAIPAHKNMELQIDGDFPELGGYIVHREGIIHVLFKGDVANQMAFTYRNYIELIARTRVIDDGFTYVKETVARRGGHMVYKITATPGEHTDPVPPYKSWLDPNYRDFYVLTVPVLARFGNLQTTKNWETKRVWIRKAVIDEVLEALMMVDGDAKISEVAISRLFSKAYTFVTAGQMTRLETPLTLQQQTYAFGVLFTRAFMHKFESGVTVSTMAPLARAAARVSELGFTSMLARVVHSYGTGFYQSIEAGISATLRSYNYSIEGRHDILLPAYAEAVGYVEYTQDGPSENFDGQWFPADIGPSYGFAKHLPGYVNANTLLRDLRFETLDVDDIPPAKPTITERFAAVSGYFKRSMSIDIDYDPEVYSGMPRVERPLTPPVQTKPIIGTLQMVNDNMIRKPLGEMRVRCLDDMQSMTPEADALVARVMGDLETTPTKVDVVYNAYLSPPIPMDRACGSVSRTPLQDIRSALNLLFPESEMLDTKHIEAERFYNKLVIIARSSRLKLDASKLEALKPDNAYIPAIKGHVLPHVKENTPNVLRTLAKRNADTPHHITAASEEEKWQYVWRAMLDVYFIPGTEKFLAAQPKIAPNERNVREWAAKQDVKKLRKLLDGESFSLQDMEENTRNLHLMLKGKLKPEMDTSYTTALKLPQSIQYDKTGKSVPVLSAPMRDIVKRKFFCYKPNVLVMQRKSPADLVTFLNYFDHRPNAEGLPRRYIEIDQTLFDKSQVREVAVMHLKYLEKLGLLDDYILLIATMLDRSVSSVKTGVKIDLQDQNISGAAFTLDRNNSVSEIVLAIFLQRIITNIEFILIMGDDVTVAVRGDVNVTSWEADLSRMFNMSSKISLHEHGYFCSMDIIHRADGTTTVVRDVVKAMCSFMTQDIKDDDKFNEQYTSFIDSFQWVDDLLTQEYAIRALPNRWLKVLPTASPEAFRLLITGMAGVKAGGLKTYRSFFSDVKHVRHH